MKVLDRFRLRLAKPDALVQHAFLGVTCGLLAGLVVVLFRVVIELCQIALLPGGVPEKFEQLAPSVRFVLPVVGAFAVGFAFQKLATRSVEVGVVHAMVRLGYHQGYLPLRNAVMQFFGAALVIVSGNSMGREGPGVHLGAATGSLLGQALALPNNSVRILVACGAAASIAASFNTPIAGVIFAMEVVMMEYTIAGFTPVILAAVAAAALARTVYGSEPAFDVPALELSSLWELPFITFCGVVVGTMGAALTRTVVALDGRFREWPLSVRTTLAGVVTGACGVFVPEVMGIGYDSISEALRSELTFGVLLGLTAAKFLASSIGAGLALPGGIVGPTLVIGAAAGGALGVIGSGIPMGHGAESGLYAMLGMGAMMAAVLNAPLSALMAIVELTANANLILPGMLAVVAATLTAKGVFGVDSLFITMMRERGLEYCNDPIAMVLSRISVAASMDRSFVTSPRETDRLTLAALLTHEPRWLVVESEGRATALVAVDAVRVFLAGDGGGDRLDLLEIPLPRDRLVRIPLQATLQEAFQVLNQTGRGAGFVARTGEAGEDQIFGVLTRERVESSRTRGDP